MQVVSFLTGCRAAARGQPGSAPRRHG